MYYYPQKVWSQRLSGEKYLNKLNTGTEEARAAGKILKQNGYEFDAVYTSLLTRAIMTYNNVADELACHHLPVVKHWRLNERHYGAL